MANTVEDNSRHGEDESRQKPDNLRQDLDPGVRL